MLKNSLILFFFVFFLGCSRQIVVLSPVDTKSENSAITEKVAEDKQQSKPKAKELKPIQKKSEVLKTEKKNQVTSKPNSEEQHLKNYCDRTNKAFKRHRWGKSTCEDIEWEFVRNSVKGWPLVWTSFGKEGSTKDVTLILCGVHGDEITPIKFCYDIIDHFRDVQSGKVVSEKVHGDTLDFENRFLVVAPMANPDSFFKKRPTRTNANGVDINRNLPTEDFAKDARRIWKHRYGSDPRRNPGKHAKSEPETVFQVNLIKRFKPLKIISVHAPLTMLDYDGPADRHTGGLIGSRANQLLIKMSEKAKGYRIKNYPFFPGSLGNYAGNERNIPTYTLELPTSNAHNHRKYWNLFKRSIHHAVMHDLNAEIDIAQETKEETAKQKSN